MATSAERDSRGARAAGPRNDALSARARWAADAPIREMMEQALARPELISLAAGFVDQATLPVEALQVAMAELLRDPERARAALQYGTTSGDAGLRGQLLSRVLQADRADPRAPAGAREPQLEQVVLSTGSNVLLSLIADALLDPGDVVLCAAPTYFIFSGLVRGVGARCEGVKTDARGMCLADLEAQLERHARAGTLGRVKAIYLVSYFDNPRGLSLAHERRAALLALAARYSLEQPIYVIEDAAYRELCFSGEDQASLRAYDADGDSVVYVGSFSKTFAPGVRVAFAILPPALTRPVLDLKSNLDFGSPLLNQYLLGEVLQLGLYDAHVARLRALYARKAGAMVEALDAQLGKTGRCSYERPQGGLTLWVELADGIDTGVRGALFPRALDAGVLYVPGTYCFAEAGPSSTSCLRLSFGVQSEARIVEGIGKLAQAIAGC